MPNLQGKIELIKQAQVDIKNAIIDKGVTPTGNISTYADAIDNIVTPNNQTKTVTENGVIRYDAGYTGLEQVTVNVNQSVQNKNITTNGTYTADSGYVGLGVVTVDVSPNVTTKTITANGTYNAEDDDVEGYSSVTVNVSSPIDDLIDGSIISIDTAVTSIKSGAFKDCEDLDTVVLRSNTVVDLSDDSIFENTPIADKTGNIYVPDGLIDSYKNNNKSDDPDDFIEAIQDSNLGSEMSWTTISYDNAKFIALNYIGFISTSVNGIIWTTPIKNSNLVGSSPRGWFNLVYNGTKFLALASYGFTSTSIDGIIWNEPLNELGLSVSGWYGLTYGGTKFVALNAEGYIATSTDGTGWTTPTQVSGLKEDDPNWIDLTYDGLRFVALQRQGYIAISTNGTTWTRIATVLGATSKWSSLTYDNGKLIALSEDGYISISIDGGTTWTTPVQNTSLGSNHWQSIISANGLHALGDRGYISYTKSIYNFLPISQLSS